jgi:hypothetical protein
MPGLTITGAPQEFDVRQRQDAFRSPGLEKQLEKAM